MPTSNGQVQSIATQVPLDEICRGAVSTTWSKLAGVGQWRKVERRKGRPRDAGPLTLFGLTHKAAACSGVKLERWVGLSATPSLPLNQCQVAVLRQLFTRS
jgi:hypothetical protein